MRRLQDLPFLIRLAAFPVMLAVAVAPLLLLGNSLIQLALGAAVMVAVLAVWARWFEQLSLADFGLEASPRFAAEMSAGAGLAVLAVGALFLIDFASGLRGNVRVSEAYLGAAFWLFLLQMALVAMWEELVFRGFLFHSVKAYFQARLTARSSVVLAVAISSLAFGLAHAATDNFTFASFAVLTLNGAVLALPVVLTGRIALPVGIHALWNFSQSSLFGYRMSGNPASGSVIQSDIIGPQWWTGGAYGPEGGVSGVLALLGIAALLRCWHHGCRRF